MSLRVLVADKSKTMRKIILLALESIGESSVVEASNGQEAIDRFESQEFDLVMTDWDMPGKTGLQFLKAIRRSGSEVPVVMLSTNLNRQRVLSAIEAGASHYLIKPFTPETRIELAKIFRSARYKSLCLESRPRMNVEFINPFLTVTMSVFETMLDCKLSRQEPFLMDGFQPEYDVSGVVRLSGKSRGTIVLSIHRQAALSIAGQLLREEFTEINDRVIDVISELANIIAGSAQPQIEDPSLTFDPPQIVTGRSQCIEFPPSVTPVCIPFRSKWGPLAVQVALVEQNAEVSASA